jgi:hypothetical protein
MCKSLAGLFDGSAWLLSRDDEEDGLALQHIIMIQEMSGSRRVRYLAQSLRR